MLVPRLHSTLLLGAAVFVMAACVWIVGQTQRGAADESFRRSEAAQAMLTARLDQETGLRGYLLNGRTQFLEPYERGEENFVVALAQARAAAAGDDALRALLDRSEVLTSAWRSLAREAIRRGAHHDSLAASLRRKGLMDRFRAVNERLVTSQDATREAALSRASWISAAMILAVSALFAAFGWLLVGRPLAAQRRREARRIDLRERATAFAHALQLSASEDDAHALVKRHLELGIPGAEITVLADGRGPLPQRSVCSPLMVSGDIIGAVHVAQEGDLGPEERALLADTVTLAAPVISNLRNLAVAQARAATDPLTGLANRRALEETITRMVAQAARTGTSLSAIALDIDHFKQVNDDHGHARGDEVLAAAAEALSRTLRVSDFIARSGGEEFVVLLPDTGLDGALVVAENLRAALQAMALPGLSRAVTASFGVAVQPEDAQDADGLLRAADRALYRAKRQGRNRVEAAAATSAF